MKKIDIYTDGACSGNPGAGGYGAVLLYGEYRKELSQGYKKTTNNRMEMLAVIKALEALKEPCEIDLYSDSKYVVDSITKGWVYGWKKKNWIKSDKKKALNVDLWERMLELLKIHKVNFIWVKGHADNVENERCDFLARQAIASGNLIEDENFDK
ncbi:MAG: ribonuclease HI [Lachnospirales bacterium]